MNFFTGMDVIASGLGAERVRMNLSSSNLANAGTTRTAEGGPYRRQDPVFAARQKLSFDDLLRGEAGRVPAGVEVVGVVADNSPPRRVFDPGHPDADADGYVDLPNIEVVEEMVNLMTAARAYQAGVTAMQTLRQMAQRALDIGR